MSLLLALAAVAAQTPPPVAPALARAPAEIIAAAPAGDRTPIAPSDLLVMDLAPDAAGRARRVVIQLIGAPFSQGWVANIRRLTAARFWDGLSVNRVQDNYVVQWGDGEAEDAAKARRLPPQLERSEKGGYEMPVDRAIRATLARKLASEDSRLRAAFRKNTGADTVTAVSRSIPRDPYSDEAFVHAGWPIAMDRQTNTAWPVHCYGTVGVGRSMPPDTGSGAELYAVIGHAPRHLDRNIAVVGRVIEGIEHLSSLPRGTGPLGFYATAAERVPIVRVRIGGEVADLPAYQYLSASSASFAAYADARANRRDGFFIRPAGGADICNVPVPVRRVK